jgi:threonine aldolase
MQLASKMRFISAQFIAYLRDDLWKQSASHANKMAKTLSEKLSDVQGVRITQRVQANGVFVIMPQAVAEKLKEKYFFYTWNELTSEYRLMTSWDTEEEDINDFTRIFKNELYQ